MLWDENLFYVLANLKNLNVWATLKNTMLLFHNNDSAFLYIQMGDTYNYYWNECFKCQLIAFISKPYTEKETLFLNDWTLPDQTKMQK
jgi:hypothetical protein